MSAIKEFHENIKESPESVLEVYTVTSEPSSKPIQTNAMVESLQTDGKGAREIKVTNAPTTAPPKHPLEFTVTLTPSLEEGEMAFFNALTKTPSVYAEWEARNRKQK